jgi:hypothetical protein
MKFTSRKNQRIKTSISCIFGVTPDTPRSGTVTSLSLSGCFVKTKVWSTNAPKMHVRLWLPVERWLPLQGIVLYHLDQIGFSLRFTDLTPEDETNLWTLIEKTIDSAPPVQTEELQSD